MLEELKKHTVIPVVVIEDENDAVPLADALLAGGMKVIEITFRTKAAEEAIKKVKKLFPNAYRRGNCCYFRAGGTCSKCRS